MTKNDKKIETFSWWNLLFPQICGVCGKFAKNSLCKKCEIKLLEEAKFSKQKNLKSLSENLYNSNIYFD